MNVDTEELKRLADAATKGPWTTDGFRIYSPSEQVPHADGSIPSVASAWPHESRFQCDAGRVLLKSGTDADNARFIAAANPAAVLALLQRLEDATWNSDHAQRDNQILERDAETMKWERDNAKNEAAALLERVRRLEKAIDTAGHMLGGGDYATAESILAQALRP